MIDSGNPILEQMRTALDAEETHQDALYLVGEMEKVLRRKYRDIIGGEE